MLYLLLTIVIVLLTYIALFTPEKRAKRGIKQVQKAFNTPLYPKAVEFMANDERNRSHPDEVVKLGWIYTTRKDAMNKLAETRKKYPNLNEEDIQKMVQINVMFDNRPK